jgi:hypothetical protein
MKYWRVSMSRSLPCPIFFSILRASQVTMMPTKKQMIVETIGSRRACVMEASYGLV